MLRLCPVPTAMARPIYGACWNPNYLTPGPPVETQCLTPIQTSHLCIREKDKEARLLLPSPPDTGEPGEPSLLFSVCCCLWSVLSGMLGTGREGNPPLVDLNKHDVLLCQTPDEAPLPSQQPLPAAGKGQASGAEQEDGADARQAGRKKAWSSLGTTLGHCLLFPAAPRPHAHPV